MLINSFNYFNLPFYEAGADTDMFGSFVRNNPELVTRHGTGVKAAVDASHQLVGLISPYWLQGDFDIRLAYETFIPGTNSSAIRFKMYMDSNNHASIIVGYTNSGRKMYLETVIGGSPTARSLISVTIDHNQLRMVRIGTTLYTYYGDFAGSSWTSHTNYNFGSAMKCQPQLLMDNWDAKPSAYVVFSGVTLVSGTICTH
jgi:hypothetical protein